MLGSRDLCMLPSPDNELSLCSNLLLLGHVHRVGSLEVLGCLRCCAQFVFGSVRRPLLVLDLLGGFLHQWVFRVELLMWAGHLFSSDVLGQVLVGVCLQLL